MPRCDRQYWAEFSNSYSQHLRYLAKAKRRTSASLNASSRQNGTCSHLRGGANMCRVGIKDARRSSQIESSKTPFASISFRVGNGLTSEKMSFAHFPVLRYLNNLGSNPRQRVNLVELTGCATHCSLRVCPCINVWHKCNQNAGYFAFSPINWCCSNKSEHLCHLVEKNMQATWLATLARTQGELALSHHTMFQEI